MSSFTAFKQRSYRLNAQENAQPEKKVFSTVFEVTT